MTAASLAPTRGVDHADAAPHAVPDDAHLAQHAHLAQQARLARLSRGVLAAGFSTFVALFSHVLAGGAVPGVAGIAIPLVFATSTCMLLATLRFSWLRLTVSVAVSQVLFHTLFVAGTASSAVVQLSDPAAGGLHAGHAGHAAMTITTTGGSMAHAGHGGGWMWLAHVVAAVVTIATLHRGEAVLARLKGALGRLVALVVVHVARILVLPTRPRPALPATQDAWVPLILSVVSSGVVRRGPPAPSLV